MNKKKIFFHSVANELSIKSDQVETLISHSGTVGSFRENILIGLLNKYLPNQFKASSGFIKNIRYQIDIIIYDNQNYSPHFNEEGIVVIEEEAVRGIIEVKTKLNSNTVKQAISHLSKINQALKQRLPIFKGIFGFDSNYINLSSLMDRVGDLYNGLKGGNLLEKKKTEGENGKKKSEKFPIHIPDNLYGFVDSICINKKALLTITYVADDEIENRVYPYMNALKIESDEDLLDVFPAFFAHLFLYLDVRKSAKKKMITFFDNIQMKEGIGGELLLKKWKLKPRFLSEHNNEINTIKKRIKNINRWTRGEISTEDMFDIYY